MDVVRNILRDGTQYKELRFKDLIKAEKERDKLNKEYGTELNVYNVVTPKGEKCYAVIKPQGLKKVN